MKKKSAIFPVLIVAFVSCGGDSFNASDVLGGSGDSALSLAPDAATLTIGETQRFTASGGAPPYEFSTDFGSIDDEGLYTAPSSTGGGTITVTDRLNNAARSTVTVGADPLVLLPASARVYIGGSVEFHAEGGVPPYAFTLESGGGSIAEVGGDPADQVRYTAPGDPGNAVVRVEDAEGNEASVAIEVVVDTLVIVPSSAMTAVGRTVDFDAVGGAEPYTFTTDGGSIDPSSGVFTAPGTPGAFTVTVTDARSESAAAQVTVNPALSLAPDGEIITTGETLQLGASGGVPPYRYSVIGGGGDVGGTGLYDPDGFTGTATVEVTDRDDYTARVDIVVVDPVAIGPADATVDTGGSVDFTASGGTGDYTWEVIPGGGTGGTVSGSGDTVTYTAPDEEGTYAVRATDSDGNGATATVEVVAPPEGGIGVVIEDP